MNDFNKGRLLAYKVFCCLAASLFVGFISNGLKWQLPGTFIDAVTWLVPGIAVIGESMADREVWNTMAALQWLMFPVHVWVLFRSIPIFSWSREYRQVVEARFSSMGKSRYLTVLGGVLFFGSFVLSDLKILSPSWPTFTNGGFASSPKDTASFFRSIYSSSTMRVLFAGISPLLEAFCWCFFSYLTFHIGSFLNPKAANSEKGNGVKS